MKGEATITDDEGNAVSLHQGETLLIPATTKKVNISGELKFLETFV